MTRCQLPASLRGATLVSQLRQLRPREDDAPAASAPCMCGTQRTRPMHRMHHAHVLSKFHGDPTLR